MEVLKVVLEKHRRDEEAQEGGGPHHHGRSARELLHKQRLRWS